MYIHLYIYTCIYICIYIHIHGYLLWDSQGQRLVAVAHQPGRHRLCHGATIKTDKYMCIYIYIHIHVCICVYREPRSCCVSHVADKAELALDRPSVAELRAMTHICIYEYLYTICIYVCVLIYNEPRSFLAAQVVNKVELALDWPSVAELLAKACM